tara:strand:- start:1012 stop:1167 length:156 start_codon:yes stop_codon:yes gene_type:complete
MKKFKTKKAHELEVAIKVRKREAINAQGGSDPLTEDEIKQIEKEEYDILYS